MKLNISILFLAFTLATNVKAMVLPGIFSSSECADIVEKCLGNNGIFSYAIENNDCSKMDYVCMHSCNYRDYRVNTKSLDGSNYNVIFVRGGVGYCSLDSNVYYCNSNRLHFDYKVCRSYISSNMITINDPSQLNASITEQLPSATSTIVPEETETTIIPEVPEVPEVPNDETTEIPEIPEVPNDETTEIPEIPEVPNDEIPKVAPNPPAGPPVTPPPAGPPVTPPPSHPIPPPYAHIPQPPAAAPSSCVNQGAQCGGINYKGPNCCKEGLVCAEVNIFYHTCVKLIS